MKFATATRRYEDWLAGHVNLIAADLELKHERMRSDVFDFLRATFYRWAQIWRETCGKIADGPEVLSVGDLHVENFGTWRDAEGRLIWGVNDFDEACRLPFTSDLIRLTTSACLAKLDCEPKSAAAAILAGYSDALEEGGRPFVLEERHPDLREMALARLHQAEDYWKKLRKLEPVKSIPTSARKAIDSAMPDRKLKWKPTHRIAGLGSLGRERYMALVEWSGGFVAREAKALAPSVNGWATRNGGHRILYQEILDRSVRCCDPFISVGKRWVVRRLAPDSSRIELAALPKGNELKLLRAMGWETANIHLGSAKRSVLKDALAKRPRAWLHQAARKMEQSVRDDFKSWQSTTPAASRRA